MGFVSGLVAHYKCDESAGENFADVHGGLTFTQVNSPGTTAAGRINSARSFLSASSQHGTRASDANLNTGDIDFAISFWVRFTDAASGAEAVFAKRTSGSVRDYMIYRRSDAKMEFDIYTASGTIALVSTGDSVLAGALTHVIAWHDAAANTINMRVNGGAADSLTTAGAFPTTSAAVVQLGCYNNGSTGFLNGSIDELSFSKGLPTTAEQTRLAAGWAYPFSQNSHYYRQQQVAAL